MLSVLPSLCWCEPLSGGNAAGSRRPWSGSGLACPGTGDSHRVVSVGRGCYPFDRRAAAAARIAHGGGFCQQLNGPASPMREGAVLAPSRSFLHTHNLGGPLPRS